MIPSTHQQPVVQPFRFFSLHKVAAGAWYTLHLLAANGERSALGTVLHTFAARFVCAKCRKHINEYIGHAPLTESSDPKDLFRWTVDFHNAVTKRVSEEEAKTQRVPQPRVELTPEGAEALFEELTTGADKDGKRATEAPGDDCPGCDSGPGAALTATQSHHARFV